MLYRLFILIVIAIVFSRCSLVKPVATNPTPSLKGLHMWDEHRGATIEEFKQHPDYDCTRQRISQ